MDGDPVDELMKMNALIRANLGISPKELDVMEYAEAYNQAIWIESFRLKNQAELLAAMFGGKKKGKGDAHNKGFTFYENAI